MSAWCVECKMPVTDMLWPVCPVDGKHTVGHVVSCKFCKRSILYVNEDDYISPELLVCPECAQVKEEVET